MMHAKERCGSMRIRSLLLMIPLGSQPSQEILLWLSDQRKNYLEHLK